MESKEEERKKIEDIDAKEEEKRKRLALAENKRKNLLKSMKRRGSLKPTEKEKRDIERRKQYWRRFREKEEEFSLDANEKEEDTRAGDIKDGNTGLEYQAAPEFPKNLGIRKDEEYPETKGLKNSKITLKLSDPILKLSEGSDTQSNLTQSVNEVSIVSDTQSKMTQSVKEMTLVTDTQSNMTQSVKEMTLVTQTVIENPQDSDYLSDKVLDTKLLERTSQILKSKILEIRMTHVTQTGKLMYKRDKIVTQTNKNGKNVTQTANKKGLNVTQTKGIKPILEADKNTKQVTQTAEIWHNMTQKGHSDHNLGGGSHLNRKIMAQSVNKPTLLKASQTVKLGYIDAKMDHVHVIKNGVFGIKMSEIMYKNENSVLGQNDKNENKENKLGLS